MTAVRVQNGQKKDVCVYRFKGTTNEKFRCFSDDICVVGKLDDGSASIRLLANYETITTSRIIDFVSSDDGRYKKLITENSVYYFECI